MLLRMWICPIDLMIYGRNDGFYGNDGNDRNDGFHDNDGNDRNDGFHGNDGNDVIESNDVNDGNQRQRNRSGIDT